MKRPHHGWIFLREHIRTEARGTESRTSTVQLWFSLESVFLSLLSAKRRHERPLKCYTSYKQFDTEPLAPCCSLRKTDAFQWRPKEKKPLKMVNKAKKSVVAQLNVQRGKAPCWPPSWKHSDESPDKTTAEALTCAVLSLC